MPSQNIRIVFFGTPDFAVASLDALYQAGFFIAGVVTAQDKPAGRGNHLQQSAVKKYALDKGFPLLQPEKLKDPVFIKQLKALQAGLQIVVAFRMLPEIVWNMPPMGTVNLHGSLLPQYRGAAPINWAVINGEKETGVTTFKLQHAIDTGNILLQESFPISETDTAGDIHDTMKTIGARLLVKTVQGLIDNTIVEQPQPLSLDSSQELKHAPKIFTDTCKINWSNDCDHIYNLVRGLSPTPTAFSMLDEKKIKIFKVRKEKIQHNKNAGDYLTDEKTFLKYACSNGFIYLEDIQLEGKKRMLIEDFLRGYRFINR